MALLVSQCVFAHAEWDVDTRDEETDQVVAELIADLRSPEVVWARLAAERLGRLGPAAWRAAGALAEHARSNEPHLRDACLNSLLELGPWAAPIIRDLSPLLAHQDAGVRLMAYRVLAGMGRAAHQSCEQFRIGLQDPMPGIRCYAIRGLAGACVDSLEWRHAVVKALRHPIPSVRAEAAVALLRLDPSHEAAMQELLRLFNGSSDAQGLPRDARNEAINAFEQLGSAIAPAIPYFKELLAQNDRVVPRIVALLVLRVEPGYSPARALASLPESNAWIPTDYVVDRVELGIEVEHALTILRNAAAKSKNHERQVLARLARSGARARPAMDILVSSMDSPYTWPRLHAVSAMAAMGSAGQAADEQLRRRCADPVPCIRHSAAIALACWARDDPTVIAVLRSALDDFDVAIRLAAIPALERCGGVSAARERLEQMSDDPDECEEVRRAAMAALERGH